MGGAFPETSHGFTRRDLLAGNPRDRHDHCSSHLQCTLLDRVSAAARFCGGRFAETSYRASTGWAARGQGAILSDDGRRWRLCFGIERMLTVRRDGVMV